MILHELGSVSGACCGSLVGMQQHRAAFGVSKFEWPHRLAVVAAMPVTPTRTAIEDRLVAGWLSRNSTYENPS